MDSLRIGVVGAGTSGTAAALLLARGGHAITVFERVAQPAPVGAGITLQPTGQAVLAQLGLLAAIEARACRVEGILCLRTDGRCVVDLRYSDVDSTLYGLGLHRGVLFETLLKAVQQEPGVTLQAGTEIVSAPRDGEQRWLVDNNGSHHGPFDLVIAADGGGSALHGEARTRVRSRPYPWGALWFVAEERGQTLTSDRRVVQILDGASRMFGILPTGLRPRGEQPVVSVFWSIRADRVATWRAAGLAAWQSQVLSLSPDSAPVIAQVQDLDQVLFTQYRDVHMDRWHGEGIVFVGDAAHATSPQLGQGVNLALWDAAVLGDCVMQYPSVETAIAAYSATRRHHLAYYQLATRGLTPFFQSDSRIAGWLRDWTFPTSRWIGPLRRRMVRTMCGIEQGIVRPPIELAELNRRRCATPIKMSQAEYPNSIGGTTHSVNL